MPPTTAARRAPASARIAKLGPVPQTIEDALASKEARHWEKAIDREMESLSAKQVWTPITASPGVKPLGSRWLFQRSPTAQGIEYRARVVAKGGGLPSNNSVDTKALSGPSTDTLFFLLAYAHDHQLYVTHIRIEDPCLSVDLEQPVTIAIPPRQKFPGKNAFLLTKALYGLKTAPAAGRQAITRGLEGAGLQPITHDPNLFVDHNAGLVIEGYNTAIAMMYDGGVVVAGPKGYGQDVLDALHQSGLQAVRGPQDLIFGLTVRRDSPDPDCSDRFTISQPQYVDRVVQRFNNVIEYPVPPSPFPTPQLTTVLKAFAGCMTWLTSTSHMRYGHYAGELARNAQRQLSPDEWLDTWEDAYNLLNWLKKDDVRNCQLHVQHTAIDGAPKLFAATAPDGDVFRVNIFLQGASIQWYSRGSQSALDDDEMLWCGIEAAVKSLIHWRSILREIEPVDDTLVVVCNTGRMPSRSKALKDAVATIRLMKEEGIELRDFPSEDDNGHVWCPCCCSQGVGDGE